MRKILSVLLVMLVATLGAVAEGAVLSGAVESGFKVLVNDAGTTIQQFTWNEGTAGWGRIKLNAAVGDSAVDIYLQTKDMATVYVPYAWVTQKFLNKALELRVGNINNDQFTTAYQSLGGIGGQGAQVVLKLPFGLNVGGFVPLDNTPKDISSLKMFKAGASYSYGPVSVVGVYAAGDVDPTIVGGFMFSASGLMAGVDVSNTGDTTIISPSIDYTDPDGKFELTLDTWTDTDGLWDNSETTFWYNYWVTPKFRILGKAAYLPSGNVIKLREGIKWNVSSMAWIRAQVDSTFAKESSHALNVMFVHSF
jgi:hypothetical protein